MTAFKDLRGQKIGRLTAFCTHDEKVCNFPRWLCVCECGNIHSARHDQILRGRVRSCGCLHRERVAQANASRPAKLTAEFPTED